MTDEDARRAALDVSRSFVVQAPAGSGKTTLLTQRLLRLLTTVREPEQVLAITFTRKAAEEMRARIIQALEEASAPPPQNPFRAATHAYARAVLAQDEVRGWDLRAQPARLRIMTIDALCQSIARQAPISAGLPSAQSVEEDAARLYREAARETVASITHDDAYGRAVALLLAHFDNDWDKLENLLAEMLAKRDQWLPVLRHSAELAALEASYARVVAADLVRVRDLLPAEMLNELLTVGAQAARHLAALDDGDRAIVALLELDALSDTRLADLPAWQGLACLLLTKGGEWRKRLTITQGFPAGAQHAAAKQAMQALIAQLREVPQLAVALARVLELPQRMFDDGESAVVAALVAVLKLAAALFDVQTQRGGRVDFVSFALAAEAALGVTEQPSELALQLDYRLQHLLVDEVQDTSLTQYRLLEALTAGWTSGDGRTLFLVGDPMQSIYRFRQAELRLFTALLKGRSLGEVTLEALPLSANFRAQAGLVEWINQVMPVACAGVAAFDVPFVPQLAVQAARPRAWQVHATLGADSGHEAAQVVALVERLRASDPAATIAILVRSRTHLGRISAELVARGHALAAREIEALGALPCIGDLLALTRALRHEADSIAWLAVLRAPWCGVGLATLQTLASHTGTVLEALQDEALWDAFARDERVCLARVSGVLEAALLAVGREPFAALVARAWLALGGPALLADAGQVADVQSYFAVLESLDEEAQPYGVERLMQRLAGRYSSPPAAADTRLQVMTIHRAKGLEFDYVIVPGCGRQPRGDRRPLLAWREHRHASGALDLLLAPSPAKGESRLFAYLRARDKEDAEAEAVRLLYVALTRARREVHLLGHVAQKDHAPLAAGKGSFFAMLWPAIEATVAATLTAIAPALAAPRSAGAPLLRRADPATLPQARFEQPLAGAEPPLVFDWAGTTAKHVGTVAHRLLQSLSLATTAREWTPALAAFARGQLRALGVAHDELAEAERELERAVLATLNSARGRWLFATELQAVETELSLGVLEQGESARVVVDRTFIAADGLRWIVDFKTGRHGGGAREAYLDSELTRYRPQLERYGRIMAAMERRPIMLGLYFPLLDGWREWPLTGQDPLP